MNISLINPPQSALRDPLAYVPLGLAYIGAALLHNGFDVKAENLANTIDIKFKYGHSDVYIITYSSATRYGVKNTCEYIRKTYPESKIILGGPHPTVSPYNVFGDIYGDTIITGEAEEFIIEYLNNDYYDDMSIYHDDTHIHHGGMTIYNAGIIENLDSLQFPARKLFNYNNVVNKSGIHGCEKGILSTTMISSRGCNYKCSFCCHNHMMYSKWRSRSAENISKEIISLKEDYGIKHIRFVDDCFTFNRDRIKKICKNTKELDISFMCITRADICGIDMLKMLKDGGCTTIDIGVESGSNRLLNMMNKRESVEQMKKCIIDAKNIGLKTKVFLQYNLPYETEEDIQKTMDFLRECKPDYYTLSKFVPLPGSDWEDNSGKRYSEWFYDDEDEKRQRLMCEIDSIIAS